MITGKCRLPIVAFIVTCLISLVLWCSQAKVKALKVFVFAIVRPFVVLIKNSLSPCWLPNPLRQQHNNSAHKHSESILNKYIGPETEAHDVHRVLSLLTLMSDTTNCLLACLGYKAINQPTVWRQLKPTALALITGLTRAKLQFAFVVNIKDKGTNF